MPLPSIIALCGNPKAGKSETQKFLFEEYGYIAVDDGEVLRRFCIEELGMSAADVYTQEGKAEYTEILGKSWQNRDVLGTLGKHLEEMFGEHIIPFIATRKLIDGGRYSFGSVRKNQGSFYQDRGGVLIEIQRNSALPSPYAFDAYDRSNLDKIIENNGSIQDLHQAIDFAVLQRVK